jgi:hypothetical protein
VSESVCGFPQTLGLFGSGFPSGSFLINVLQRGCPFGNENWTDDAVPQLGLETTLRPRKTGSNANKGS